MIIAIIPARIGSKRIKKKNIKLFFKKPIISYPINALKKSKIFDKIIVSSDSELVGRIARDFGVDFYKRSKKLSGDKISTRDVILDVIHNLKKNFINPTFVCCIYPTTPLITSLDIWKSYKLIKSQKKGYIFSAIKNSYPIERSFFFNNGHVIKMINKKSYFKRSQDLKETFRDAGQFYWAHIETWLNQKIIFNKNSKIYLLQSDKGHDVDTYDDWRLLKKLYKMKNIY